MQNDFFRTGFTSILEAQILDCAGILKSCIGSAYTQHKSIPLAANSLQVYNGKTGSAWSGNGDVKIGYINKFNTEKGIVHIDAGVIKNGKLTLALGTKADVLFNAEDTETLETGNGIVIKPSGIKCYIAHFSVYGSDGTEYCIGELRYGKKSSGEYSSIGYYYLESAVSVTGHQKGIHEGANTI